MCLDKILHHSGFFEQKTLGHLNDSRKPLYRNVGKSKKVSIDYQNPVYDTRILKKNTPENHHMKKKDYQYNDETQKKQKSFKKDIESGYLNYTSTPIISHKSLNKSSKKSSIKSKSSNKSSKKSSIKSRVDALQKSFNESTPIESLIIPKNNTPKNNNEENNALVNYNEGILKAIQDAFNDLTPSDYGKSPIVQNNTPEDINKKIKDAFQIELDKSTPSDWGKSPLIQNNTPVDYTKNILKAIQDELDRSTPSGYGKSQIVQITIDQEDIENVGKSRQEVSKLDNVLEKLDGLTSVQKQDAIVRRIEKMKQILKNEKCSINKSFLHDYCALKKSINEIRLEYYENKKYDPYEPNIHWSHFDTESTFDRDN